MIEKIRVRLKGFTLIEIMMAIVIFTVGIIAIMSLFPISVRDTRRARIMTQAAFLCQAKMEEVISLPGTLIPPDYDKTGKFSPDFEDFSFVVRKYPYVYKKDGSSFESYALSEIHVSVFHSINDRKAPLCEYYTIKGSVGEQWPDIPPY